MNVSPPVSRSTSVAVAPIVLAVMSLAAAAIHFAVMGEHFAEYAAFGLFFSLVGWLQALWAVGVVIRPTRPLLLAGQIGNGIVALVWVVSRTAGLPIGPDAGIPEPAAFVDVLTTILEVAIVAGVAVLLMGGRPTRSMSGRIAWVGAFVLAVGLVALTTWAVADAATAGSGGQGHGATQQGSTATSSTGRPGYARVSFGNDRMVQVLIDPSGNVAQVHLAFFEAGKGLDVRSVSMSGTSPAGQQVDIPVALYEPAHFAASAELEPGNWTFRVKGVAPDGRRFDISTPMTVEGG